VTSGTDSNGWINRFGLGGRYTGTFAGFAPQGYGVWIVPGKADTTIGEVQPGPADLAAHRAVSGLAGGAAAAGSPKYDGLNLFNDGLAAIYMGFTVNMGFTINANTTIGRINGSKVMAPTGGVPEHAELPGISNAYGPFSVGADAVIDDAQGSAELVGTSSRTNLDSMTALPSPRARLCDHRLPTFIKTTLSPSRAASIRPRCSSPALRRSHPTVPTGPVLFRGGRGWCSNRQLSRAISCRCPPAGTVGYSRGVFGLLAAARRSSP
jgi:hypothetical protein